MAQFDQGGNLYTFASEPKTVTNRRKARYRDPYEQTQKKSGNIMWDARVYRGSAFASQVIPPSVQEEMARREQEAELKRRRQERRQMTRLQKEAEERIGTPPAVEGRKHVDMQTDAFLEEILERPVEVEVDTQTDAFLDRPPSPLFVPQKSGIDAETQIYEGDLFDFDLEVDPLLEVIVGKTLEQSMMEVLQEEELEAMTRHQRHFAQVRNAELDETQRLEAAEKRRAEEKERRKQQERDRLAREKHAMDKLAARQFSRVFLQNLERTALAGLDRRCYFFDTVEREVEGDFIPWLFNRAQEHLERKRNAHAVVDALVGGALKDMVHRGQHAHDERIRKIREEEERVRREAEESVRRAQEAEARRQAELQRKAEEEAAALAAQQQSEEGGEPPAEEEE